MKLYYVNGNLETERGEIIEGIMDARWERTSGLGSDLVTMQFTIVVEAIPILNEQEVVQACRDLYDLKESLEGVVSIVETQ